MEEQKFLADLKSKYYCNVDFPVPKAQIDEAMEAFFRFLDESHEVKSHIDYKISTTHRRGDIGFTHRDPKDDIYNDSKDFFHFHPSIFEKYPDFVKENEVVANFVNKAMPIWEKAEQKIKELLSILDQKFPGTLDKVFETKYPHLILRFLKYNWQQSGEYLAKPHYDAGSFTLAIAESCEGLRIGSCPDDLQKIEHEENKAVFMLASNFKKVLDSDDFKAGWHDVVQTDENLVGKPFARWAMVVFIEAAEVEALSRDETHKYYNLHS